MPRKTFTKAEGYSSRLLLHYGRDHLRSAQILFERSPACYDSAGFLTHLGIELFLKAVILDATSEFPNSHDLWALFETIRRHDPSFELDTKNRRRLLEVDKVATIRYPRARGGLSIGSAFWGRVQHLIEAILQALPANLRKELKKIDPYSKGDRVLMSRPKTKWERDNAS